MGTLAANSAYKGDFKTLVTKYKEKGTKTLKLFNDEKFGRLEKYQEHCKTQATRYAKLAAGYKLLHEQLGRTHANCSSCRRK